MPHDRPPPLPDGPVPRRRPRPLRASRPRSRCARAARRCAAATRRRSRAEARAELEARRRRGARARRRASTLLAGARTVVKSPGVPAGGAGGRARRASAGSPCVGELEIAWRLLPNDVRRRHGLERQDDDGRARSATSTGRPGCRGGRRQRRHGAVARSPGRSTPDAVVVCEASSFQLEDTLAFAPDAAVLLNVAAGPPRPPRHASTPTARRSCGSSPARPTRRSPSRRSALGVEDLGGCARRVCFGDGGRARSWPTGPGSCGGPRSR